MENVGTSRDPHGSSLGLRYAGLLLRQCPALTDDAWDPLLPFLQQF